MHVQMANICLFTIAHLRLLYYDLKIKIGSTNTPINLIQIGSSCSVPLELVISPKSIIFSSFQVKSVCSISFTFCLASASFPQIKRLCRHWQVYQDIPLMNKSAC
jgi:hypothetical protein